MALALSVRFVIYTKLIFIFGEGSQVRKTCAHQLCLSIELKKVIGLLV